MVGDVRFMPGDVANELSAHAVGSNTTSMPELVRYRPLSRPRREPWAADGTAATAAMRRLQLPNLPPRRVQDMSASASAEGPSNSSGTGPSPLPSMATAVAPDPALDVLTMVLENLGKGKMSVKDVGLTAKAVHAYARNNEINELAAMAGQKSEARLHDWLEKAPWRKTLPELCEFDLLKAQKGPQAGTPKLARHAAILPHELFASLHAHGRPVFEGILTGGSENLQKWWAAEAENASKCTWYHDHPARQGARHELLVPLGIHGDDAGVQGQESVTVLTWGSVAVEGPTLDSRLIFCMLKESEAVKPDSLHKVLKVFTWSLTALAAGTFPSADEEGRAFGEDHHPARAAVAGQPLTSDGHRGCWAEMRGDWKFLHEALHTRGFYGTNECCHLCAAVKSGPEQQWFTNFAMDAELRSTRVTSKDYMAAAATGPGPVSPLLGIPGFNIWRVQFDIMHTLDLGVLTHALPSALTELTAAADVFPAPTREGRLAQATQSYHVWCKANNIASAAKEFTKRWCEGPYPCIGQFQAKAAAIRSMVYWFKVICDRAATTLHGSLRATMMNSFVEADEIMRRSGRHLPPEAQVQLAKAMERALCAYNALAAEAVEANVQLWKLLPKHHAMTHIAYDNGGTNPRKVSCYLDEDMVGRMKRIYCMCHGSTAPRTSLQRYIILCGLRWKRVLAPAAAVLPVSVARRPRSGWQRSHRSRPY